MLGDTGHVLKADEARPQGGEAKLRVKAGGPLMPVAGMHAIYLCEQHESTRRLGQRQAAAQADVVGGDADFLGNDAYCAG